MIRIRPGAIERLKEGMSDTEFSKQLGISRSQLWRAINERNSVGETFIECLLKRYPEVSFEEIFFIQDARSMEGANN